jgi:hypothetical protein
MSIDSPEVNGKIPPAVQVNRVAAALYTIGAYGFSIVAAILFVHYFTNVAWLMFIPLLLALAAAGSCAVRRLDIRQEIKNELAKLEDES